MIGMQTQRRRDYDKILEDWVSSMDYQSIPNEIFHMERRNIPKNHLTYGSNEKRRNDSCPEWNGIEPKLGARAEGGRPQINGETDIIKRPHIGGSTPPRTL